MFFWPDVSLPSPFFLTRLSSSSIFRVLRTLHWLNRVKKLPKSRVLSTTMVRYQRHLEIVTYFEGVEYRIFTPVTKKKKKNRTFLRTDPVIHYTTTFNYRRSTEPLNSNLCPSWYNQKSGVNYIGLDQKVAVIPPHKPVKVCQPNLDSIPSSSIKKILRTYL